MSSEFVRVWLVERTYSDDEQNLIILQYATIDGKHVFRKERALTSFSGDERDTPVMMKVEQKNLADVTDSDQQEYYASEATTRAQQYESDNTSTE